MYNYVYVYGKEKERKLNTLLFICPAIIQPFRRWDLSPLIPESTCLLTRLQLPNRGIPFRAFVPSCSTFHKHSNPLNRVVRNKRNQGIQSMHDISLLFPYFCLQFRQVQEDNFSKSFQRARYKNLNQEITSHRKSLYKTNLFLTHEEIKEYKEMLQSGAQVSHYLSLPQEKQITETTEHNFHRVK